MNYLQLPDHLNTLDLTGLELKVYCDVWTMTQAGKQYWKSNEIIAQQFGVEKRSVIRVVTRLESRGLLERDEQHNGRYLTAIVPKGGDPAVRGDRPVRGDRNGQGGDRDGKRGDPAVTGGVTQMAQSSDRAVTQIEKNREDRIEKKREENRESASLVFPWESLAFLNAWEGWKAYKQEQFKFKYKSVKSEQIALHKLHKDAKGNERVAIDAIAQSIASGWRGLFPESNSGGSKPGCNTDWVHEIARDIAERNGYQFNEPDAY